MKTHFLTPKLGFNDESDAVNAAIQEAASRGNAPTFEAIGVYQSWIDGEIVSWDVPVLLTDPIDLAIFKAARVLWMELADTGKFRT